MLDGRLSEQDEDAVEEELDEIISFQYKKAFEELPFASSSYDLAIVQVPGNSLFSNNIVIHIY